MSKIGCKGLCDRNDWKIKYNIRKGMNKLYNELRPLGTKTYGKGYQICRICQKYLQTLKVFCPCCGGRLSKFIRNRRSKIIMERYHKPIQSMVTLDGKNIKNDIINNLDRWRTFLAS